jgi:hypothetical protein
MRLPASARALGWRTGKRAVDWSASKLKLASYVPMVDYREQLDAKTTLTRDARPIRDKRSSTVSAEDVDLTLTLDGLEDVASGRDWGGRRMLEVGPKYGIHTRWIDEHLAPSFVAFSDFEEDRHLHEPWEAAIRAPHAWVFGDLRRAEGLLEHGPFDVVFFPGTGKAKMVPTFDALRIELAWTGWRDVTVFTDYRPESDEVLLLCRKTDELGDADVADVVRPQRGPAAA